MPKPLLEKHILAIQLRLTGNSYTKIKNELNVSKSTLSLWLRNYPLSEDQLNLLSQDREQRIERFRQTMQNKKNRRLESRFSEATKTLLPLTTKEIYIIGLFL